jgi:predicted  nucleic acid-binding Zn-ribbon protein
MEQREAVELDAQHAEVEVASAQHSLAESVSRRDEAFADIDTVHARRTAERVTVLPDIPAPLLAQYERIRANKGVGAALLRGRKCGACRIELDRSAISRIKEAAADEVLNCDECGVILVRTPESGL